MRRAVSAGTGRKSRGTVKEPASSSPSRGCGQSLRRGWWPLLARAGLLACVLGTGGFCLLWVLFPYDARQLDEYPAGRVVTDSQEHPLRVFSSSMDEFCFPVDLEDMSPWLVKATLAVEDRRFYSHPGVDPLAIARAVLQNVARGRVHSGASTLTQQLVRILDRRPRTLWSKAVEAFCALQLEQQRSKDQLIEAYLNLAPYGGNLRGVEAASLRYFGKHARDLSLSEASLLAGLPQSPSRLRPDRHRKRARWRQRIVLDAMVSAGYIPASRVKDVLRDALPVRLHDWPFRAPHFAELARRRQKEGPQAGRAVVRTTLDERIQRVSEIRLQEFFAADAWGRGRLSGGVVVLEAATGAVRAMVGSPSYMDVRRCGAINSCLQPRSPGSALKPFLYALAFAKGVVNVDGYLADTPLSYAAYLPENYDRKFHGPVPAADAMALSLNVPAVRLQQALGTRTFLETLRRLGFSTLRRSAGEYGLQLALGGCEVTLTELATAYATLLRLGVPVRRQVFEPALPSPRANGHRADPVLLPGACGLVLECLSRPAHLQRAIPDRVRGAGRPLGYKTGTSFGLRDAWAVAFTARHVVAVWAGDPRGKPHPTLVGAQAALPVAVSIASELARDRPDAALSALVDGWVLDRLVDVHQVCALSGMPASSACPRVVPGRFPRGAPLPDCCKVHQEIRVDAATGLEVCPVCARGRKTLRRIVEVWPNEVELWFARTGIHPRSPERSRSQHDPTCKALLIRGHPKILSPADGAEFLLAGEGASSGKLFFKAAASREIRRLLWFLDGKLLAREPPLKEVSWKPRRGLHLLRCVDEQGRAAVVRFRVRAGG